MASIDIDELLRASRQSLKKVDAQIQEFEADYLERSRFKGESPNPENTRKLRKLQRYRELLMRFILSLMEAEDELNAKTGRPQAIAEGNDAGAVAGKDEVDQSRSPDQQGSSTREEEGGKGDSQTH